MVAVTGFAWVVREILRVWGALSVTIVFMVLTALLHHFLPANLVRGYACDRRGRVLLYRLNGFRVLCIVIVVFVVSLITWTSCTTHSAPCVWLTFLPARIHLRTMQLLRNATVFVPKNARHCLHAANILGLIMALAFYIKGARLTSRRREHRRRALTADMMRAKNGFEVGQGSKIDEEKSLWEKPAPVQFFLGREFNPRFQLFDYKMFFYLWGAVALQLICLSNLTYQWLETGTLTIRLCVYVGMFTWFVADYMYHEDVHLFTYDLFAERMGFKLVWGCIFFYPFFYTIGVWSTAAIGVEEDVELLSGRVALWLIVFLSGWVLSRGANNQKYQFKRDPDKPFFFGLVRPKSVVVYCKAKVRTQLLCSGWWGYSRHINYLGEILMGLALALPGGSHSWLPWLYPLYYILLLVPRERDDNRICHTKYGRAWREYCRVVPYRIIPYIY